MYRPTKRVTAAGSPLLLFIAACVTVNIYFPAAQVEKTAQEIVSDVYEEEAPPTQKKGNAPQSLRPLADFEPSHWLALMTPRAAYAEEATTVSNAVIRGLKDEIGNRHRQLLPYYEQGRVGIDKQGYLTARDTSGLNLAQVAALKRLVEADNAARGRLYDEVARALNLQSQQMPQVQEIFAKEWRDKAKSGWWVQNDDGTWAQK